MRTKSLRLVIVVASAMGMAGCVHIWNAGPPCVGNGCPTGAGGTLPGVSGQVTEQRSGRSAHPSDVAVAQPASGDQASAATAQADAQPEAEAAAQASDASAAAPATAGGANVAPAAEAQANSAQASNAQPNAQEKPGKFTRLLQALHLHSKS